MFEEYKGFRFRVYEYKPDHFAVSIYNGLALVVDSAGFATFVGARKYAIDTIDSL